MKKTQLKDALRNIWKQKVSYLSVIVISFLGVLTFLGINYSDGALRRNGSLMYNAVNFRDIEIASPLLLSPADMDDILRTEGVQDAEAVMQTVAKVSTGEMRQSVNVISLTERINLPQLVDGRLPEAENECAVEERLAGELGWHIGDEIETLDAKGKPAYGLTDGRFVITGIANHPDHTSTSIPDTLYVMVLQDAFDREELDSCFMKAEIVVDKPAGVDRFSKQYNTAVETVLARLEEIDEPSVIRRSNEVRLRAQTRISEGQEALETARTKLEEGRSELDKGWAELEDAEEKIAEGEKELEHNRARLHDAEDELWSAKLTLDAGKRELAIRREQLDQGRELLDEARVKLDEEKARVYGPLLEADKNVDAHAQAVKTLEAQLADAEARLAAAQMKLEEEDSEENRQAVAAAEQEAASIQAALDTERSSLSDAEAARDALYEESAEELANLEQLEEGLSALEQTYSELEEEYAKGEQKYKDGQKEYSKGLNEYYTGLDLFNAASDELETARLEAAKGRKKLEDGEKEYAEKSAEYEDAVIRLDDAKEALENIEMGRWLFFDCQGNSSFVQLLLGSSNLASLEMTFSMLFMLLGALVIYATISKMIDEQRNLVGAGKALGLYNREVFAKYLLFGVSATLIGTLLGTMVARYWMEVYVLKNASPYYTFDTTTPTVIVKPTLIVVAAGVLLSVAATWFACTKLLRSTAIELMLPRVPGGKKTSGKESGHVLSLYSRLILLNIRTDLRRVIVTVVSVAGCCALVVIGFTLKSAVEGALVNQYEKIVDYDGRIRFDAESGRDAGEKIAEELKRQGADYTEIYDGVVTFRVTENLVGELICGDLNEISSYYHLLDWKTEKPLVPTDSGIFVQKRTAESYDLEVGSELELTLGNAKTATVRVAGIFDNYIGRIMLMSPAYYREKFGTDCDRNAFFIRLNGTANEKLLQALREISGFESYSRSDADRRLFASSSSLVTAVVALFIFMAAIMAGVVLTNLTNIYILQKKPELTIMRINGFTVREVIGYVARETVVTTLLGIVIGIAMGAGISYNIIRAMESVFIQYDRSVSPTAWLLGALITGAFSLLINTLIMRKIKYLKLTDLS